jgi:hypothetical protein
MMKENKTLLSKVLRKYGFINKNDPTNDCSEWIKDYDSLLISHTSVRLWSRSGILIFSCSVSEESVKMNLENIYKMDK